jgi:lactate permease
MPAKLSLYSAGYGMLFGLWPVCWIVVTAVFIYNLSVKTGEFEIIKNSLATISDDRRIQALLIAFSFGAFIEGAAGFGTPVAITAAMLAGLGFKPLYAAGICLIANTARSLRRHRHSHHRGFPGVGCRSDGPDQMVGRRSPSSAY